MCHFGKYVTSKMGHFDDDLLRNWAISKILKISYYENVQLQKCVTSGKYHFENGSLRRRLTSKSLISKTGFVVKSKSDQSGSF